MLLRRLVPAFVAAAALTFAGAAPAHACPKPAAAAKKAKKHQRAEEPTVGNGTGRKIG